MSRKNNRRNALKQLGATLLGLVGWNVAKAATPGAEGGLFASLFLQEGGSVKVPLGYYDPKSQRYVDAKTHKPIFVPDDDAPAVQAAAAMKKSDDANRLTDEKLASMLGSGGYIDVIALERMRAFGQWGTGSTLTTLSTTGPCCPIVTDSKIDRLIDDTPEKPPG